MDLLGLACRGLELIDYIVYKHSRIVYSPHIYVIIIVGCLSISLHGLRGDTDMQVWDE